MSLLSCPPGPQANICPRTTDEVLPSVLGHLPLGPAWDGGKVPGTVQNTYWRAYSNVLGFTYGRLCDYVEEFFCATVNESRDQWAEEFNLNDPCDPYGSNLCVKVAAQGGANCEYFVAIAEQAGWVIGCEQVDLDEHVAGCNIAGCTPLGPTPAFVGRGNPLGYGEQGACTFNEANQHPDPANWEFGRQAYTDCRLPGTNLGLGPDENESCCNLAGYYDFKPTVELPDPNYCSHPVDTITFDCPREGVPKNPMPMRALSQKGALDSTRNYSEWGHSYLWLVTVDIAASFALQGLPAPAGSVDESSENSAGCGEVGCTPLCVEATAPDFVLCFLERLKPAHTKLLTKVIQ